MTTRIITGDCRDVLATLPAESVHCVVTSPPYWGLRDYGTATWNGGDSACEHVAFRKPPTIGSSSTLGFPADGGPRRIGPDNNYHEAYTQHFRNVCKCGARRIDAQIGLEPTYQEFIEQMVAVFREVRRVMRHDATLWLNLGDAYKDKQLLGMPWQVAQALQSPFYTGRIKSERDRVWLAAMIDAEGTICGFRHERKDGAGMRTGTLVFVTNGSERILNECDRIWPGARYLEHLKAGDEVLGATATRDCWRWQIQDVDERALLLREIWPHLVEKRQQAVVGYALTELSAAAKRHGRGGDSEETKERRLLLAGLLSDLNQRRPVCLPTWLKEPPSIFEPGYYLRQDLIWSKSNPMPESVTDRCTKAHEYLFLLTKSARYYFDAEAIKEPASGENEHDLTGCGFIAPGQTPQRGNRGRASRNKTYKFVTEYERSDSAEHRTKAGLLKISETAYPTRNRRSVWEVATAPFSEAHFATFPPALIEPCILAGTSEKGCCAKCGAPWRRETEKGDPVRQHWAPGTQEKIGMSQGAHGVSSVFNTGYTRPAITRSWSPSCACDAAVVPAIVLDPFGGAGTTGLVADRLQRDAILIELNPSYAEMAHERVVGDAPLFARCGL